MGFHVVQAPDASQINLSIGLGHLDCHFFGALLTEADRHPSHGHQVCLAGTSTAVYRGETKVFQRRYRADGYPNHVSSFSGRVEQGINSALMDLVQQMLGDLELLAALGSTPTVPVTNGLRSEDSAELPADVAEPGAAAEAGRSFFEGRTVRVALPFMVWTILDPYPRPLSGPYHRLWRYSTLMANHMYKFLPGSQPLFCSYPLSGTPNCTVDVVNGDSFALFHRQANSVQGDATKGTQATLEIYKGGREGELTIGGWPDDPMVFQVTNPPRVDWDKFVWIGGLRDNNNGKRVFFALPPGIAPVTAEPVRRAFEKTASYPGLFAEGNWLGIDISNITPLGPREVAAMVAGLIKGGPDP